MAIRVTDPAELPPQRPHFFLELAIAASLLWFGTCTGLMTIEMSGTQDDAWGFVILLSFAFGPLLIRHRRFLAAMFAGIPAPPPPPEPEPEPEIHPDAILLGKTLDQEDRQGARAVYLDPEIRNRHVYLIGKTRTGKTTLLKQMIVQDMERGAGCGFIDPHGDAAEDLLGLVPEHRTKDVIYFDPTQVDAPAFNPFELPYQPAKLTEDVVSVFRMLVGDSWGPRMEHLLRFGVLTLIVDEKRTHTLRDLRAIFLDEGMRHETVAGVSNRQIQEFWGYEYPTMPKAAASPILNKLSAFLAPMSDLERVFSRHQNELDFSRIMDEGKILIVNLAKGILGDEPSRLLGGLLVACIQQAALARVRVPMPQRRDFFLYVDEFQNFTVSSFSEILSESAKYRLNLTLANQTLGQIPTEIERAIFGNVGTVVSFQVSAQDAPTLRKEMHRSHLVVRPKNSNHTLSVADFRAQQLQTYTAALEDPYLGMAGKERRRFSEFATKEEATRAKTARRLSIVGQELNERRQQMRQTLRVLSDPTMDVAALRHLFPDYEFRDRGYPDVDDFINLEPHHSFCRIGSAENVFPMRSLPPLTPEAETRERVLQSQAIQAAASAPNLEDGASRPPQLTHEPETHDDFTDTFDEPDEQIPPPT